MTDVIFSYLVNAESESDGRAHHVRVIRHPLLLRRMTACTGESSVVIFRFQSALLQIFRGVLCVFAGETVHNATLVLEIVAANVLVYLVPHIFTLGTHF